MYPSWNWQFSIGVLLVLFEGLAVQPHCPILSRCSLSLRKFKIQLDHWKGGFDVLTSMNLYPADPATVAMNSVLEDYPAHPFGNAYGRLHGPLWDQSSSQCFFTARATWCLCFIPSFLVRWRTGCGLRESVCRGQVRMPRSFECTGNWRLHRETALWPSGTALWVGGQQKSPSRPHFTW